MKSIPLLQKKFFHMIDTEIERTKREIEDFEQKKRDNESYYGCGGFYRTYEKAIERRENHLHDLDNLKKSAGTAILTDEVTVYSYSCPNCRMKVMLSASFGKKTVDCPVCNRTIYACSDFERFEIVRGSRWGRNNGSFYRLKSDGSLAE